MEETQRASQGFAIPQRLIMAGLLFLIFVQAFFSRPTFGTAVYLLRQKHQGNVTASNINCPNSGPSSAPEIYEDARGTEYKWSASALGLAEKFYLAGYGFIHPFGGYLADKYGGKHVVGFSVGGTSLLLLIIPFIITSTNANATAIIIIRTLHGIFQGVLIPAATAVLSHWSPPREKARLCCLVYNGIYAGMIVHFLSTVTIIKKQKNWVVPFYIYGGIGIALFILWLTFGASNPETCTSIHSSENFHLRTQFKTQVDHSIKEVPIFRILLSADVWALVIGTFSTIWIWNVVELVYKPYMISIVKLDRATNQYWQAAAYVTAIITSTTCCTFSDWAVNHKYVNQVAVRKVFVNIGNMGSPIYMLAGTFANCNKKLAEIMFFIAMGLSGSASIVLRVITIDISPNYAGFVTALTNGVGVSAGILVLQLAGATTPKKLMSEYKNFFLASLAICTFTNFIFIVFGHTSVKDWNRPPAKKIKAKSK